MAGAVQVDYPANTSGDRRRQGAWFESLRQFTEFLDARGGGSEQQDCHGGLLFNRVLVFPRAGASFQGDLRHFQTWLEGRATSSTATATTAVRFPTKHLCLVVSNLTEHDERWQVLAQHGRAMLGHLLSLGRVTELTLHLDTMDHDVETASPLLPPFLEALPGCQTLKRLSLFRRTFDADAAQALVQALPNLHGLDEIVLEQFQRTALDPPIATIVLRAALDGNVSQVPCLEMRRFDFRTIDSEIWDLLSGNHTLKQLRLVGCVGRHNLEYLASALMTNTGLRCLTLWDRSSEGGFDAFAGVLAVNTCLEELIFNTSYIVDSDLLAWSEGLRHNRRLRVLKLLRCGLTPTGLRPLIEVVRYHNHALEEVIVSFNFFSSEALLLNAACRFHCAFRAACQAHRVCGGAAAADDDDDATITTTGRSTDSDSALRPWWPVLGSNHPTAKATVIFCEARVRAEIVAQSLQAMSRNPRKRPLAG